MLPQAVVDYLQANRERHLAELFELLAIPSIANNDDDGCDRAAAWLVSRLEALGLRATAAPSAGKANVLAELHVVDEAPTVLIYGHYDVQPPDPLELWDTGPFEPVVRDGWILARGADDDKGQLYAHLMAIEAWQRAGGGLPVNVKMLLDGEEEIGSPSLEPFIIDHAAELSADVAVVSDSAFFAPDLPSITYSLRGLVYLELTVRGPSRDIHSGLYGGPVANPVNALAAMIAQMHDQAGRVTIPGFYDSVVQPGPAELRWGKLPFDQAAWAADIGVAELAGGEAGRSTLERIWARPTLDCNGIVGGYTAPGSKTIIPAEASAKISMRLVPHQDPAAVAAGFEDFVAAHTPAGLTATVKVNAQARPVLVATDSPAMTAARAAYLEAFGREAVLIRCGASVPVTELIQRLLGLDAVLMGFGTPEARLHSPNERFPVEQFYRGGATSAAFMHNLASAAEGQV